MVKKYVTKEPLEAIQFDGTNTTEVIEFFNKNWSSYGTAYNKAFMGCAFSIRVELHGGGEHIISKDEWLVKNCDGSFTIMADEDFQADFKEHHEDLRPMEGGICW